MMPIHEFRMREPFGPELSNFCLGRLMRSLFCLCGAVGILIILCGGACTSEANEDGPPFDVDRWLNGPDREDFPWDVQASYPSLTLQQRYRVEIRVLFDGGGLRHSAIQHDLHFVLKVASGDSNWVPGYSHTRVPFPPQEYNFNVIDFSDSVYLRPGRYTIALIVFDPILKKGNLWRKRVKVSPISGNILPELDRDLPDIEFTSKERPLAEGKEWLPVKNSRSLCIDIVANISMDWHHERRLGVFYSASGRGWSSSPRVTSTDILQVASVLSHLGLRKGRVRVSIVDPLWMKTLFNREDAAVFDWQRASQVVEMRDPDTIDIGLLVSKMQASAYLVDKLQEILKVGACAPGTESPLKIVIVVSTHMVFAKQTVIRQVVPQDPASVRFFHFRIPKGIPADDDLYKMLKSANPQTITVADGLSFRKELAVLISRLENLIH